MEKEPNHAPHLLSMENRTHLNATGVLDVDRFDEQSVVLLTTQGVLTVEGEDLHINRLNVENSEIAVEGTIYRLQYSSLKEKSGGVFKSLFR